MSFSKVKKDKIIKNQIIDYKNDENEINNANDANIIENNANIIENYNNTKRLQFIDFENNNNDNETVDINDLDSLLKEINSINIKPIKKIDDYYSFNIKRAIIIPTKSRCTLLRKILDSLIKQPLFNKYDLYLSLDGEVSTCIIDIIDEYCVYLKSIIHHKMLNKFILPDEKQLSEKLFRKFNPELVDYTLQCSNNYKIKPEFPSEFVLNNIPKLSKKISKFEVISTHIKSILDYTLLYKKYDYSIVLEDDLLTSPDFLNLFYQLEHFLYEDETLFCISSWNDNGREGFVSSLKRFYRTDYMPGLGWMTSRKQWITLTYSWKPSPSSGWDHYIRTNIKSVKKQCIFPEIPRVKHLDGNKTTTTVNKRAQKFLNTYAFAKEPVLLNI